MKKTISILLALLMAFTVLVPAFAEEGGRTVTFVGPSSSLLTKNPAGEDIGEPYYFVKTVDGKPSFVEDPNGIYYLANDGYYHTAKELLETPEELAGMPTYSPEKFAVNTPVSITSGENLSFMVMTNEAYNAATANVYINDVKAETNEVGEYVVYVDRDFTVRVNENDMLKTYFNVILTSGKGYSVKTLQGQNYAMVPYGGSFSFRVKIANADGLRLMPGKDKIDGFAIRGEKKDDWKWANAVIEGDEIVLSSPDVPKPVAVRYGWARRPRLTLESAHALPLRPFSTDHGSTLDYGK